MGCQRDFFSGSVADGVTGLEARQMECLDQLPVETFADYLAKALIARKGYRRGTVPEARALFSHCDAVLTRANGVTLTIAAIIDRITQRTASLIGQTP